MPADSHAVPELSSAWFSTTIMANLPAKKPQQAGVELLMSGEFGRVGHKRQSRAGRRNLAKAILNRGYSTRPIVTEDLSAVSSSSSICFGFAAYARAGLGSKL